VIKRSVTWIGYAAAVVLALALTLWASARWLLPLLAPPRPLPRESGTESVVSASPPAPAPPSARASALAPRETEEPTRPTAEPEADAGKAMRELFGPKTTLKTFLLDDFARRVVATVDGLGRTHVSSSVWPVVPTGGRFQVESRGGNSVIAADNGLRYSNLLLVFESVDMRRLSEVYRTLRPQFQQAYVELGYPGRQFDQRLLEIIDQLLSTPEVPWPVRVHLPEIQGPISVPRPWVLYEFDEPELQSLSAGQKILLRMGPVNLRRSKRLLAQFRKEIATPLAGAR